MRLLASLVLALVLVGCGGKSTPKADDPPSNEGGGQTEVEGPTDQGACLDEVGCLLAEVPPACCARYHK